MLSEYVESRKRDIAIRKAIGAGTAHIHVLLIRHLGVPCAAGVLLGCVCGYLLASTLSSYLFGVGAASPVTIGAAVVFELLIGVAATAGPLVRANRVDAVIALRAL